MFGQDSAVAGGMPAPKSFFALDERRNKCAENKNGDATPSGCALSSFLDVTWIAPVWLSQELPNPAHYVIGTDWNFSVGKNLVLTPSCYCGTYHIASGRNRARPGPNFAWTPCFPMQTGACRTVSPSRQVRCPASQAVWFYRNRPRVDYRLNLSRFVSSLFVQDEVFYFSKYKWVDREPGRSWRTQDVQ